MTDEVKIKIQTYESPWPSKDDLIEDMKLLRPNADLDMVLPSPQKRSWFWRVYHRWVIRRELRRIFRGRKIPTPPGVKRVVGGFTVPKEKS